MTQTQTLHLFEGFGIEIEYMLVGEETLQVAPVADQLLMNEHGTYADLVRGPIGWCNELVNHVIELRTAGPAPSLAPLADAFHKEVVYINRQLKNLGACLLPGGMHPLMDPAKETVLWPHDSREIYEGFDRLFNCQGHGWSNLQSVHINLPFNGDAEFGRLHAAVRLVLPLLPALAAASPLVEGRATGCLNNRLSYYRDNCIRMPSVTGSIVPEPVWTRKDYEMTILARIYQDLAPLDPDGVLQHEWVNARGAIARFDRSAIELRLLDVQECPAVDLAVVALVVAAVRAACGEQWISLADQKAFPQRNLVALMRGTMAYAHQAPITDAAYLAAWGYTHAPRATAGELLSHLAKVLLTDEEGMGHRHHLQPLFAQGPLAQRITKAVGKRAAKDSIVAVYRRLAQCLQENTPFIPQAQN